MCQLLKVRLIKVLIAMIPGRYFSISDYIKLVNVKHHIKPQVTYHNCMAAIVE